MAVKMIIYKITNKINGKVYIGQTINKLEYRWQQHCHPKSECVCLRNAIQKHGKENFTVEQIDVACDRDELDKKEEYWISYYECLAPKGYNLHTGGIHHVVSEETREKMRKASANRPCSEETRKKLSALNKGRKRSKEYCERASAYWKGKMVGDKNPMYGKHHSEKARKRISEFRKGRFTGSDSPFAKKVMCIDTGEIFDCMTDACVKYNLDPSTLTKVCKGVYGRKTCKGYHWKWC